MLRTILLLPFLFSGLIVFGECTQCTSMEQALIAPEQVKQLDLSSSGLLSLPQGLEKFTGLEELDLSNNMIGEINSDKLYISTLKELRLSGNRTFNAMEIERLIRSFPNIERLYLDNCGITYLSPDIGLLKQLKKLDLSKNSLRFVPEELASVTTLINLNASNNKLSDAFFLRKMWNLKTLDLSGNRELPVREIAAAMLFKNTLDELIISGSDSEIKLPAELEDVAITKLVFKGGSIGRLNFGLCRNSSIECLVFDNVYLSDHQKYMDWINNFENVQKVEFRNLKVPIGIKDIKINEVVFASCEFQAKEELKKIYPRVNITAIDTDINNGKYVGNALTATLRNDQLPRELMPLLSDEMKSNKVEPIVSPAPKIHEINSATSNWIEMTESNYSIPENAFLREDGSIYNGKVELQITEYMDPIINALSGAPMVFSQDGNDELFSSNGMIEFKAYDESGEELLPNPENIIQVELRDLQPEQPSNLYAFDPQSNNWQTIGRPAPTNYDSLYQTILDSLNKLSDSAIVQLAVIQRPISLEYKKSRHDPYLLDFKTFGHQKRLKSIEKGSKKIFTSNLDQEFLCKKMNWKLDTTISEEMKKLLARIKYDQKEANKYWTKKHNSDYYYAPRILTELKIEPNFVNDNYNLSFYFKDTLIQIPVYPSYSGSLRQVQEKEKQNYKEYEKHVKSSSAENDLIERYSKRNIKLMADQERELKAKSMVDTRRFADQWPILSRENAQVMEEYNRFGLTSFGLVNCDYFSRNTPDYYVQLDTVGQDMDGNWVRIPPTVRNIYTKDNVYVATSSDNTPIFEKRKTIIIIVLSSIEIAIVRGWIKLKNGFTQPKVERINIEGMNSEQVKTRILQDP